MRGPQIALLLAASSVEGCGGETMGAGGRDGGQDGAGPADASTDRAAVSTEDLVAEWTFDEATGTSAGDSIGGQRSQLMNGSQWIEGHRGSGLSFDGAQA